MIPQDNGRKQWFRAGPHNPLYTVFILIVSYLVLGAVVAVMSNLFGRPYGLVEVGIVVVVAIAAAVTAWRRGSP